MTTTTVMDITKLLKEVVCNEINTALRVKLLSKENQEKIVGMTREEAYTFILTLMRDTIDTDLRMMAVKNRVN